RMPTLATVRRCDASIVEKPRANVSCTICRVRTCSRDSLFCRRKSNGRGSLRDRRPLRWVCSEGIVMVGMVPRSATQVDDFLEHLVGSGDDAGVALEAALGDDQPGELLGEVDVRHLEGARRHRAAASGAGHPDLGEAGVGALAPCTGDAL